MKCSKNTESKNPRFVKTKNGRIMLSSNCPICSSKKSRFPKEQEASATLGSLRKTLGNNHLFGPLLFQGFLQVNII